MGDCGEDGDVPYEEAYVLLEYREFAELLDVWLSCEVLGIMAALVT